ncbi:MAG TPA: helix-turn-helix domain-containing protein, partial [Desulfurococcales archaeon]|nr:helix-turn-helix domain-containing protein [Desulfurococcales archaeon]
MSITDKFENLKFRLMVVERLRLLKRMYSYKELSKVTGVPETVLCRYVKGSILPSLEQAERIWKSRDKILD